MRLESGSPGETIEIGRRLGGCLRPGSVVCLYGDVGAGKTTLIKGIASAFGIPGRDITSASFTIIAEYETDPPFHHIDLYRLRGGDDVRETGVDEYLGGRGVAVVEWAERLGEAPAGAVTVRMGIVSENNRALEIEGLNEEDRDHLQAR